MPTPDQIIAAAAERHRATKLHTVVVVQGRGWGCTVCDPDMFDDNGNPLDWWTS